MKIVIRFRVRMHKNKPKAAPHFIYCRLRVNGVIARSDMATGVSCLPSEWDNKAQRIRGYSDTTRNQNVKLQKFRDDLDDIYNTMRRYDTPITAEIVKQAYLENSVITPATLLTYYEKFLTEHQTGRISQDTMDSWLSRKAVLTHYIANVLKRRDIDLLEAKPQWAQQYYKHHTQTLLNSKTHAARAISAIRSVLDYAVVQGAIESNPLLSLHPERDAPKAIHYLTETETQQIANCPFFDNRLQHVADCFLIQCYTGMAYAELKAFDKTKHLQTDSHGVIWLMIERGKTKVLCRIPLLATAKTLFEKYQYKLPIITNQKMNEYVKEVAKVAQLPNADTITTHVGRRTMGTFLLNRGVSMEVVSKVLGHKSIKVTERHYAALLTSTIAKEMKAAGLI